MIRVRLSKSRLTLRAIVEYSASGVLAETLGRRCEPIKRRDVGLWIEAKLLFEPGFKTRDPNTVIHRTVRHRHVPDWPAVR